MPGYSPNAKTTMLNAINPDELSLHSGDPGETGANEFSGSGYSRQSGSFASASGTPPDRNLQSALDFDGPATDSVPFFGMWEGGQFRGGGPVSGQNSFNAEGRFRLTTATRFDLEANGAFSATGEAATTKKSTKKSTKKK